MLNTVKQAIAVVMCAAIAASGCASTGAMRIAPVPSSSQGTASRAVLIEYVQKLPPGTAVRVDRTNGRSLRGTLMKATGQSLFVQPKTRIPEAIVEIPMDDLLGVTPVPQGSGNNIGRAIGAGAAAGAGATLAFFLILIAAFGD